MTTIAQLAAYLATLPQDAEVRVLEKVDGSYATYTTWTDLKLVPSSDTVYFSEYNNSLDLGKD